MNRDKIIEEVLYKMFPRSIVIKVIDIVNFEGSQIDEVYKNVNDKKHRLIVVINKIDALPKGLNVERTQKWVKDQISHKINSDIVSTINLLYLFLMQIIILINRCTIFV